MPTPKIRPSNLRFTVYPERRQRTSKIVVHHTAGSPRQDVHDIHAYHLSKGWIGIGYSLVQDAEGEWWEGRGLDTVGAHATGHNANSIGVCLIGNFEDHPLPAARYQSLVEMVAHLCRRYSLTAADVVGHRELPGARTLCPGRHLDLDALRWDVQAQLTQTSAEPVWRVIVDGVQVGAYRYPSKALADVIAQRPKRIVLERV